MRAQTSHLLVALFFSIFIFFGQTTLVQAQVTESESTTIFGGLLDYLKRTMNVTESSTGDAVAKGSKGVNGEKATHNFMINSLNTTNLLVQGSGAISGMGMSSVERKELEKAIGFGFIGDLSKGIASTYTNPPASSVTYMADLMKNAKIIPSAQAQGLGFSSLDPILETWKAFRNLAYLFFVVAFIVIGFMIMFRVQVGKAAITVQQAIPNIIIALLAVTFSYAIAGFMIDIMYVVMYMLASFFTEGPDLINKNIFGLVGLMFKGGDTLGSTQNAIEQFMEDAFSIGFVGEAVAWLSSLLGSVIIGIAILFATFKIFFELVKTYIAVLLSIIFSPILLMMGAFSGNEVFFKWLKNLAGNLILWPVVLVCILVQRMLTAPIRSMWGTGEALDQAFGGGFLPPFLMGQGQGAIVPVILGIGVLLVIPEIMQQVKKAMGVSDGMFGELAKAAFSNMKNDSEKTVATALPIAGGLRRGIPELKSSYDAYKDYYAGSDPSTAAAIKFAITGGSLKDENRKAVDVKGFTGAFGGGFEEGQKLNTSIKEFTSGDFLRQNFAKKQYEATIANTSKDKEHAADKPKTSAVSEGSDEE
jgi:hypothetical protein